ncbi:4-demethylwyosine synthase TYW1 [archaeon]|nr:4-demethylwyosine synthase TYW1 [archaeon]MBT6698624.1 4-demethylwyosine synthase TYW1 [archaeon]
MLTKQQIQELEKQQYRMVGNHSAVKVCGWTKKMLRSEGACYKFKFYGIRSHQCMQMTSSMFCANRCTFCWRGEKAPVAKVWKGEVDDPDTIIELSQKRHMSLLQGFGGNDKTKDFLFQEAKQVRHVALSLTGEPIAYPKINELLEKFHKAKISTFLVTNAQYPEQIAKIKNVTQFYISVDAPNKIKLKEIDRPLFPDFYERLLKSLDIMKEATYRTCIRLTIIKDQNDLDLQGYKTLIMRGSPDFIEVKGYMHVGASRKFLERENMPMHEEIDTFTQSLIETLGDEYTVTSEHKPSRVLCLMHKRMQGKQYIDFPKFFEIVNKENDNKKDEKSNENNETPIANSLDYSNEKMTPNC